MIGIRRWITLSEMSVTVSNEFNKLKIMKHLKLFENFDNEETTEVTLQNCLGDCRRTIFKSTSFSNALDICEEAIKKLNGKRLPLSDQSEAFNDLYTLIIDTILWVEDSLEMKYKTGLIKDPLNAFSIEKKYSYDLDKVEADPLKKRCYDLYDKLAGVVFVQDEEEQTTKMSKAEIQELVNTYLEQEDWEALKKLSKDPKTAWFFN